jgi:hypothetical protein
MILTEEKRGIREKSLSQCHFVYDEPHTDWSGIELGSPR